MAKHGWIGSVALAMGGAAGAAATQFGLAYGLGIVSWAPQVGMKTTDPSTWLASLAWTTWIAATATVLGAVLADRRSAGEIGAAPSNLSTRDPSEPPSVFATVVWRALLAVSAGVGATLSIALVLVPARMAVRDGITSPQFSAAGYAIVGVIAGIVIAGLALSARATAINSVWSASYVWLLAIAVVIDRVAAGHGFHTAPLATWPFANNTYWRGSWSFEGAALMLGAAFVIGVAAAWHSALVMKSASGQSRALDGRTGMAMSGAIGPLLITVAYELAAPGLADGQPDPQLSAFLLAPLTVVAGIAGSVLLVAGFTSVAVARSRDNDIIDALATVPPQRPAQPSTSEVLSGAGARSTPTEEPTVEVASTPKPGAMPTGTSGPSTGGSSSTTSQRSSKPRRTS
jgi:hypothetical protein